MCVQRSAKSGHALFFFFFMIVSKPSARSDTLVQWLVVAGWEFVKSSVAAQSAGAVIH